MFSGAQTSTSDVCGLMCNITSVHHNKVQADYEETDLQLLSFMIMIFMLHKIRVKMLLSIVSADEIQNNLVTFCL